MTHCGEHVVFTANVNWFKILIYSEYKWVGMRYWVLSVIIIIIYLLEVCSLIIKKFTPTFPDVVAMVTGRCHYGSVRLIKLTFPAGEVSVTQDTVRDHHLFQEWLRWSQTILTSRSDQSRTGSLSVELSRWGKETAAADPGTDPIITIMMLVISDQIVICGPNNVKFNYRRSVGNI